MIQQDYIQWLGNDPVAVAAGVKVCVYRLDLKHSTYSGNKFYKLLGLRQTLVNSDYSHVISFGGIWSNHLLALSRFGLDHAINTIGLVRSTSTTVSNPLLNTCRANGMQLEFLSPAEYRQRTQAAYMSALQARWPRAYLLPEGGSSQSAIAACANLGREICQDITGVSDIVIAVGTGSTMAGMCQGLHQGVRACGVPVVKRYREQAELVRGVVGNACEWQLARAEDAGAYGRLPPAVAEFIRGFEARWQIRLDPNYNGKAFYWFFQALAQGHFARGATVVLVHTGGLFGRLGYSEICNKDELTLIASH